MLLQVSPVVILEHVEEANEETTVPMSVDESHLHAELFSFSKAEETTEVAPEPFLEKILEGEGNGAEGLLAEGDHGEKMPEIIPRVGGGFEVQPAMEDVDEEPPITLVATKVSLYLGASHIESALDLPRRRAIIPERNWSKPSRTWLGYHLLIR